MWKEIFNPNQKKKFGVYNTRTNDSRDDWETPHWLFKILNNEFHFTIDLAASNTNKKCSRYYSTENSALKQNWSDERAFCNPPFILKDIFIRKAVEEQNRSIIVMVLPVTTSTKIFHSHILQAAEIRFIEKRVNYSIGGKISKGCNFETMIVIFEKHITEFPIFSTLSRNSIQKNLTKE
jgi:phage N-6-adenine-methyltransferase